MSNTNATHSRFWAAMIERYGKRWVDSYSEKITRGWSGLIDRFTPENITDALAELKRAAPEFPPTMPQFEALLEQAAARRKMDPVDHVRTFWRSLVVHEVSQGLDYADFHEFEQLVIDNKATLGAAMLRLLNDLDHAEKRTGQRTRGMEEHCIRASHELAQGFDMLRKKAPDPVLPL